MINTKIYCLDFKRTTVDNLELLFDARKWCEIEGIVPLPVKLSENTFKALYTHPQFRGGLGIPKYWPLDIEIYSFKFVVDVLKKESVVEVVPVLLEDGSVSNTMLKFEFEV
jgi:hypothetical protein